MEEARELLLKHLYLQGGDGLGISDGKVYNACLDAIMEALTIPVVSNSVVCDGCGDTGRGIPTLQEPDGVDCEKCSSK